MPRWSFGPWLWGPRADLLLFGGSAACALLLMLLSRALGRTDDDAFPDWAFVACILAIDVAHVYSTLFRTYFDLRECRARPLRYFGLPLLLYAAGVLLYLRGPVAFWRTLAYLALFHFVRQQVGWVRVYQARQGRVAALDRSLDTATVYVSTLYPVAYWHAHLAETRFAWFVSGDFLNVGAWLSPWLPLLQALWVLCLSAFLLRQVQQAVTLRRVELGKNVVVLSTALLWYLGIVATNSDFDFTVSNVIAHGVPYMGLLWFYARERAADEPPTFSRAIVVFGLAGFLGVLWGCAFLEEALWDRWVWHEHAWLFGTSAQASSDALLTWLVPLLALPQATHYALDGLLWRSPDTRRLRAQRAAFGFR